MKTTLKPWEQDVLDQIANILKGTGTRTDKRFDSHYLHRYELLGTFDLTLNSRCQQVDRRKDYITVKTTIQVSFKKEIPIK